MAALFTGRKNYTNMNLQVNLERIREQVSNAIIDAREEADEKRKPVDLEWALDRLKLWPKWYLRKNQPKNYFRITRILPAEFMEIRSTWVQHLQLWSRSKLLEEYVIDADTYDFISSLDGWEEDEVGGIRFFYYRNPVIKKPK